MIELRRSWDERPFARTFDLISSAYGWSDDLILDLTLTRMRQVREMIWLRQEEERRKELKVAGAVARAVCQYIASASGSRELVRDARDVSFLPKRKLAPRLIDTDEAVRLFGAAR